MASPQKENGYTPIANEIMEQLARLPLNGTQWRILITIWRFTYGFSRKEHDLSLNFIANAVSCPKTQVKREIDRLISSNILTIEREASFNQTRTLSFNKDYTVYQLDDSTLIRVQDTNQSTGEYANQSTGEYANQSTKKTKSKYKTSNSGNNCPHEEIKGLFNSICASLPSVKIIGKSRASKVNARWKDMKGNIDTFVELFTITEASDFLSGRSGQWKCSFDWLMDNDKNYCKVLEGNYDGKSKDEEKLRW